MLTETLSICPDCRTRIPARLVKTGEDWYMEKTCPEHGFFRTVVWRGLPALEEWDDYAPPEETAEDAPLCPDGCGLCSGHRQDTCCVLIEITSRCSLHCPVCFAESGEGCAALEKTPEELYRDFCAMTAENRRFIQLSGGEPTVRDDLPEIVAAAKRAGATTVQLNSNGLRLASEPGYAERLRAAGLDFVFMQFDGVTERPYEVLRARPLLKEKLAAIDECERAGLGVTLVPTVVPGLNVSELGDIVRLGVERSPAVRGVHFQPVSYFGRYPAPPKDSDRVTLPEVVRAIVEGTDGLVKTEDFLPSRCDHPRCGFHADYVVMPDGLQAITHKKGASAACAGGSEALKNRRFIERRWKRDAEAESFSGPADSFDGFLARLKSHSFTLTAMAFQDAWNLDITRLRRCSLHVYRDGKIVPFCANYI